MKPVAAHARLWGVLLLVVSALAHGAVTIRGFRAWQGPQYMRLVFDLSGSVSDRTFSLSNPDRLVVDLKGVSQAMPATDIPRGSLVQDLRVGPRPDGVRLVVDLKQAVRSHVFLLNPYPPYGYRLVIDFRAPEAKTPAPAIPGAHRGLIIAIDPGHGGDDPGATGVHHIAEKNVVLAIARDLDRMLNATPGMHAFLTRTGDYYVPLRRRFEIATERGADAFVSIHADSLPGRNGRRARGSSIYILSRRGASREAGFLARSENASDFIGGASLDVSRNNTVLNHVLIDMSQTGTIDASQELAGDILGQLRRFGPVHTDHVDRAAFMVLSSPEIPSVLIETEFLSNPYEAYRLATPSFQRALAHHIWRGIMQDAANLRARRGPPPAHVVRTVHKTRYVVKPGETLGSIARRYHVDADALRRTNGLHGNRPPPGARLEIPQGAADQS